MKSLSLALAAALTIGALTPAVASAQDYRYAPPPPAGASPPHQWGDPTIVRQRLGEAVTDLFFDRDVMYFQILSPQHQRLFLEANVGPVGKLVENLGRTDPVRLAAFRADLEQLMATIP